MNRRPLFTVVGIPVYFDPYFLFGALLIFSISGGGQRGLLTVVALVIFVVVHELGHAFTARAFGASVAVTVTFLGGFASYVPSRPLKAWQSNLISLMGPLTQFTLAIPVMIVAQQVAQGATSTGRLAFGRDLFGAVAWAGILLACVNLLPLWPLDGGRIAQRLIERVVGPGSTRMFLMFSIVASALLLVSSIAVNSSSYITHAYDHLALAPFQSPLAGLGTILGTVPAFIMDLIFIPLFSLIVSISQLRQEDQRKLRMRVENQQSRSEASHAESVHAARNAERESWVNGAIAAYPRGWAPSPWVRAHVALLGSRVDEATAALAELADGYPRNWLLDRPERHEIGHLMPYVPPQARQSLAFLEARVHHGSPEELVSDATDRFAAERSAEPLYLGAAGLANRGYHDEAMQWLQRAVTVSPDPHRIATERSFHALHRRSDFQQLLGEAQRAVASSR